MTALAGRLEQPKTPVPTSTFEVVTRRINQPTSLVQQVLLDSTVFGAGDALQLGPGGVLRIDKPFSAMPSDPTRAWQATGRLYGRGPRIVRYARVELEIAAWSDDASELRLLPVARHLTRWGTRRHRRYFTLAHDGADFILELLTAAARSRHERPMRDAPKGSRIAAA
jgi:hypothetical protein